MKFSFLKKRRFWWRFIGIFVLFPVFLITILLAIVYFNQDSIIQSEVDALNKGHKGKILIGDTHLEPFEHFPFISIKVDDVRILESKKKSAAEILNVADIYLDFDFWDILSGNYDIQELLVEDGFFNIVFHKDGTTNLENALATTEDAPEEEPMDIHLKKIKLKNLDIHKLDEETNVDVETYIYSANGGFQTDDKQVNAHIDTKFELNVMDNGDTTYINHKHFDLHTDIAYNKKSGILKIKPSSIRMEHGDFKIKGSIDVNKDITLDLSINGEKPNFDMLIAFAPEDLIPVLERYKNAGKIYFNAKIKGPTLHGKTPFIDAQFGASEAFLENTRLGKRIDEMGFEGHFTNGDKRSLKTTEFSLKGMTAKLEKGNLLGSILVKNFENPEVDMHLKADVDLEFLTKFLNLDEAETSGKVLLEMRFHDIIDLDKPELALSNLNQAYFSELKVDNFSMKSKDLPAPLKKLDLHLMMNGKKAEIDLFNLKLGNSDLSIKGFISDLPAIIHHTNTPVATHLEIESNLIDLTEITHFSKKDSTGLDEQVANLKASFSFNSSARAFTESKYLPEGEFFIDDLYAQLKHYPHKLHDFHVDILVGEKDLNIKDFTGYIDDSDFHFNGLAHDYGFWLKDTLNGDVDLDITLSSKLLRLEDLFSYGGENYVPEEYRHEEIDKLILHLNSSMHYKESSLHSIDLNLDKLNAKMHLHPMRFENFMGRFHYEDDHLQIQDFHGKIGRTIFDLNLNYYLGENPKIRKRDNHLGLEANYIDFDQLFNFKTAPNKPLKKTNNDGNSPSSMADSKEHSEAFNLYEIPFTDMTFDFDIGHFIYHRLDLQNIVAKFRTNDNHYLFVDKLNLNAAGGSIQMDGYFNGSDPKHIYLKPNLQLKNIDLDKLLFKFENFGQDAIVSENLHGKLNALIKGKIRVYPDMIPDIDQSEIHMDMEVLNGRLENYEYMLMLSDYFGDKNLSSVRFDTLQNHMDITNGKLSIPNMSIESTLGHFELAGTQDMDFNMDYYLKIPWSVIKKGARYKLFGKKKAKNKQKEEEDQIIEIDPNKKTRFLNLKIFGNIDDYKITLRKKKRKR
ncbi:MAG: AsmA-like C-terminal region-containing protein [Crocinitomicaceae bacterium]|nr:AsmA-like C-terminal region-containing protein [Crocinitomicaceae bacterium]